MNTSTARNAAAGLDYSPIKIILRCVFSGTFRRSNLASSVDIISHALQPCQGTRNKVRSSRSESLLGAGIVFCNAVSRTWQARAAIPITHAASVDNCVRANDTIAANFLKDMRQVRYLVSRWLFANNYELKSFHGPGHGLVA